MALADDTARAFKLDETTGDVIDSTGTNNGTNNGATRNQTGLISAGKSFLFDGVNDYVNSNYVRSLTASTPISISFWFKTTDTVANGGFVAAFREAGANDPNIQCNIDGGKLRVIVRGDGGVLLIQNGATTINDGNVHNAIFVFTTTTQKVYLDGNTTPEISQTSNTGDITLTSTPFFVGAANIRGSPAQYTDAIMDDVNFFDKELTEADRETIWNSGDGFAYPFSGGGTNYTEDLSETMALADALQKFSVFFRDLSDTQTISDTIDTGGIDYTEILSDTQSLSDAVDVISTFSISISDTLLSVDTISSTVEYNRTLSETLSITDSVVTPMDYCEFLSETLSISDVLRIGNDYIETLSEAFSLTEFLEIGGIETRIRYFPLRTGESNQIFKLGLRS